MHPNGYIEVRDRAKDIVISGGGTGDAVAVEKSAEASSRLKKTGRRDAPATGRAETSWY